jgi:hypothetical protein
MPQTTATNMRRSDAESATRQLRSRVARFIPLIVGFLFFPGAILFAGEPEVPLVAALPTASLDNGDFERPDSADPTKPALWDKPDGLGIQWAPAPKDQDAPNHGKAIRMDTAISEQAMNERRHRMGITQWTIPKPGTNPIAETYGLSYYSVPIEVKPGATYRLSFDFKGPSGGAKVWVRGWGVINGQKRRRYEVVVNCRVKENRWTAFSQEFHPTKNRPDVTEMRVMLFAYYPAGVYWFDNVKIERVGGG